MHLKKTLLNAFFSLLVIFTAGNIFAKSDEKKAAELLATGIGKLAIQYEGLIGTIDSFAQAELFYITGKKTYKNLSATFVVLGIIYQPERWQREEIIPLRHKKLRSLLRLQESRVQISAREILSAQFAAKLSEIIHNATDATVQKAAQELFSRAMHLTHLSADFCIIPPEEESEKRWQSPFARGEESLPQEVFALNQKLRDYFAGKVEIPEVQAAVDSFVRLNAPASILRTHYPPYWRRWLDSYYARYNPFRPAMLIYLLAAVCWFIFFIRRPKILYILAISLTLLGLIIHTSAISFRFLLAGFIPLSNMYESLVFFTWAVILIAIIYDLRIKFGGVASACATVVGFLILITLSLMPLSFSRIVPLRAVLNSAWLAYHVIACILAYAAFAMAFIVSLIFLVKDVTNNHFLRSLPECSLLDDLNYRFIQLGWPLLGVGILTGAIWADTAWGRAWSWDPKETWSLITWLIYAGFFHLRLVKGKKGRITAIASVVGFVAVLMTWFGVSYLKIFSGGLHTYA